SVKRELQSSSCGIARSARTEFTRSNCRSVTSSPICLRCSNGSTATRKHAPADPVAPSIPVRGNALDTIDIHTHYVPRGWPDLGAELPWLRVDSEREAMIMVGSQEFRAIRSECWDAEVRVTDVDEGGGGAEVVSPTPVFFSYGIDGGEAEKVSRVFNDLALEICEPEHDRLLPFCQVPLQDTDAACRELERSIASGHVGVEIGNHVGDRDLDDEGIVTFLQHAASLDVPVFVHPWDMPTSPRLSRWMAQWITGMPT